MSPKTRERLAAAAKSVQRTEAEVAAAVLEATFEADDHEVEFTRQAIVEADAGDPFAKQDDVRRWLKSWATEDKLPPPEATIRF